MTIFILFISIIINIVSIFAIIILYIRQNRLMHVEQDQKKVLQEMEEMFSTYLIEIRDENEEFIKKVQSIYHSKMEIKENVEADKSYQDKISSQNEQKNEVPALQTFMRSRAEKTYQSAMTQNDIQDAENQSIDFATLPLEKQAYLLEKEGMTIEQIAKELHKGKTEIELLLKFRQKI